MDVGLSELLLIFVVALIVLGPQRLPEVGAALGRALYEFRRATAEATGVLLGAQPAEPALPPPALPAGQPCVACGALVRTGQRFCVVCGSDQEADLFRDALDVDGVSSVPADEPGASPSEGVHAPVSPPRAPVVDAVSESASGASAVPFARPVGGEGD